MLTNSDRLADRLCDQGAKALAFFRHFALADWERTIYTAGTCWTAHEVLAHFVSAEEGRIMLIRNVLAGRSGAPDGFDIDAHNEQEVERLRALAVTDLLRQFAGLRRETAYLVGCMSDDDLSRTGRDPYLGIVSLEDMIKLVYRHNQIHIREMRRALGRDG